MTTPVTDCLTLLHAIFRIRLADKSEVVEIRTVGEAFRFLEEHRPVEWLEFYGLYNGAKAALEDAAVHGIKSRQATDAFRTLLSRAKLL
jgi:hypothetical protein